MLLVTKVTSISLSRAAVSGKNLRSLVKSDMNLS